jgi:two-component system phosphate regulon sensor histidine kinase PhoR
LTTYLCVHQPQGDIRKRAGRLLNILTRIGLVFVVISASGTWIFVGWLVERYESNLAVSEERNRTLVQNSDAIVVIDDNGMILHTNPSAESLFGVTGERARMRPVSDFWQSDALSTPSRTDTPEERESEIRTGDGRTIAVSVRTCKIDFLGNDATYLLFRDTTESRRAREEITEANRRLKELDRLKSDFLNTVSHELRTPLTSIKWSTESLSALSKNWDEETFSKLLRIIRDDNQRLTKLVEQLLSFSKLDAGQLAPKFEPVALEELVEKAALEMEPIAASKDIEITIVGSSPDPIIADREQVRLLLTNLLDNAIKYSPRHSQISIALAQNETDSTISINDSGIGINKEDIDNIFDRFYRADRAEVRDETGTGLGLAIVKGILDAHAGSVSVESVVGEGSTFRVRLPAKKTESESS